MSDETTLDDIADWEASGFTERHPTFAGPNWRVRLPYRRDVWDDAALECCDEPRMQQAWAAGLRAEFPAHGPIRCDVRTFLPRYGYEVETDFGFAIRTLDVERAAAVLFPATNRMSCVDECGAEWPAYNMTDEVYTPNSMFGPTLRDGLLEISVDSQGVSYPLMWRTMLCIARDALLAAGFSDVTFLPLPQGRPGRPPLDELGADLLQPGDVGYRDPRSWRGLPEGLTDVIDSISTRVRDGAPPTAEMARRVRRAARSAGDDVSQATTELVAALADSPALLLAKKAFWTTHQAAVTGVVTGGGALAAHLLAQVPPSFDADQWLDYLTEIGLARDGVDGIAARLDDDELLRLAEALIAAGSRSAQRQPKLLEALVAWGPRLAAASSVDGAPTVTPVGDGVLDLDVADVLTAHGVPWSLPDGAVVWLPTWLDDRTGGRRDLAALLGRADARRMVLEATRAYLRQHTVRRSTPAEAPVYRNAVAWLLTGMNEVPGLRQAMREWVRELLGTLARANLAQTLDCLDWLEAFACPAGHDLAGDLLRGLQFDPVDALARTVRAGLLAELSWPALEEAVALTQAGPESRPDTANPGSAELLLDDAWPELIVRQDGRVALTSPTGARLMPRLTTAPARGGWGVTLWEAGGDLLVVPDAAEPAYWLGQPDQPVQADDNGSRSSTASIPGPDGARLYGRVWLRGCAEKVTSTMLGRETVLADSGGYWVGDRRRVLDPDTGRLGARGLPGWIERAERGVGGHLAGMDSRPASDGLGSLFNRLGSAQPVVGLASLRHGPELVALTDPSGATLWASVPGEIGGVLRQDGLPARVVTRAVDIGRGLPQWGDMHAQDGTLLARGNEPAFWAGWPTRIPVDYWYNLSVREPAVSAALRHVDAEQLRELVAAAHQAGRPARPAEAAALHRLSGQTGVRSSSRAIGAALLELGRLAARQAKRSEQLALSARGTGPVFGTLVQPALVDQRVIAALSGFVSDGSGPGFPGEFTQLDAMQSWATTISTQFGTRGSGPTRTTWSFVLAHPRAVLARAAAATTPDEMRQTLCRLVITAHELGLYQRGVRVVTAVEPARRERHEHTVNPSGEREVCLHSVNLGDGTYRQLLLVLPPSPACLTVDPSLRSLAEAIAARPAPSWDPSAVTELAAATGLPTPECALLIAGLPADLDRSGLVGLTGLTAKQFGTAWANLTRLGADGLFGVLAAGLDEASGGLNPSSIAEAYRRLIGRSP